MTTIKLSDGTKLDEAELNELFNVSVAPIHTWGDVHSLIHNVVNTRSSYQLRVRMNPHHPPHDQERERIHVELYTQLAINKCKEFFLRTKAKPETNDQQQAYDCIKKTLDDDFNFEVDRMLSDTASRRAPNED